MKKIYAYASALMMAGVLAGGLTSCNNNQNPQISASAVSLGDSAVYALAYINVDSLLTNYDFAKDLNEVLIKKTEDARANFNGQAQAFERDYNEFQRKLQTNAFLNEQRAQSEANRLEQKKNQLDQLNAKLQQELAQEQLDMNTRLNDTIQNFLKEYNAIKKFQFIFSNTMNDNILIAAPQYDITAEVLQLLNERYAQSK